MQKNLVMSVFVLLFLIGFVSAADFSRTWDCNNGLGGCTIFKVCSDQEQHSCSNCGQARAVINDSNKVDDVTVFRFSNYAFDVPNEGAYSCQVNIVETGYGYYNGPQLNENSYVWLNGLENNYLGQTIDGGCNSGTSCKSCTDSTTSFSVNLNLKNTNNVIGLEHRQSHGLRSVSISCDRVCEPWDCSHYSALGQCGNNLDDNCNGKLSCFSNCLTGQPCTLNSQCPSGICDNGICVDLNLNVNHWANMEGGPISNSNPGDTVLMICGGQNLEGRTIWYIPQEFNSSFVWYNPLTWWSSQIWNDADKIGGNAYQPWVIPSGNTYKKRFTTLINLNGFDDSDGQLWNQSGNLSIIEGNGVDGTNFRPIIGNVIPEDELKIAVNNDVWFNQTTTDEDDLLEIIWNFGDGTPNAVFQNYSSYIDSSSANVKHSYTNPDVYYWRLTAKEMNLGRDNEDSVDRTIYVYKEGINVIPIISSPLNRRSYGSGWVFFNATQSYVVNCTTNVVTDTSNFAFRTDDDVYNCSYIHKPGTTITPGYKLTANWTLDDPGRDNDYRVGLWNTTDSTGIGFSSFDYFYFSGGVHNIKLRLIYED